MVRVASQFCIDRYEDVTIDRDTKTPITPYYPPDRDRGVLYDRVAQTLRGTGTELEQATETPLFPPWQREKRFEPVAVSKKGAVPQGYASGVDAARACVNAGKRLCTESEWTTACRGEQNRQFPYGDKYERGRCNVFGKMHPGVLLWENPSKNHTDPRMNLVKFEGKPLLFRTGSVPTCKSDWEGDAVYDLVGNLDEWVDDPEGTFKGGFYARSKTDGCDSTVKAHPLEYGDYSTGIRCCRALDAPRPNP